jgi:HEPN superfamily RES-like protein/RES domain-containing protein
MQRAAAGARMIILAFVTTGSICVSSDYLGVGAAGMPNYPYQDSDLAVCGGCFADEGIKGFIEENATDEECSFCGATSENLIAASIQEVAEFIEEGVRRAYGNPDECGMSWDSEDQRYYPGSTYDTTDLVSDLVDLPNDDDGKLFDAICYNFDNDAWCDIDQYRLSDHEQLQYSWDHFCRVIKHERRFFFSGHFKYKDDDEIFSPGRLLEIIFEYAETIGLIRKFPCGTRLYRVRQLDGASRTALDLGPPPPNKAWQQNRMSPAGIPMLYASEDAETALRETFDQPGLYTIGEFTTARDATVIDFSQLPRIPSLFEPIHDTMEYDPGKLLVFLHRLREEFSKPIERDGNKSHIEYVPTQVVTEYLRGVRTQEDLNIDGIRYASARHEGSASLVLFCDPHNLILPTDQQSQFYDLHRDRWIKLVGHSDRDISAGDIQRWKSERPKPLYRDPTDDIFRDPEDDTG